MMFAAIDAALRRGAARRGLLGWVGMLVLAGLTASAGIARAADTAPSVEVKGMKNPELRSYRSVSAGLDAFERRHALAPGAAALRFRLLAAPRGAAPGPEPLALRIVGEGEAWPLAVDEEGLVTIPRNQQAYDDDAELVSNRKRGQLIGLPEVRSAGLPQHVRRLGDLRLECEVLTAVLKVEMGFLARSAISALLKTTVWCGKPDFKLKFHALARLDAVSLVYQQRRVALEHGEWDYLLPISDPSWPDDALVELSFK